MPIQIMIELFFNAINSVLGEPGLAIIGVSIVVQLLVLPMYKKADKIQEMEREKQKKMEHWVKHIKKSFKGDERFMML